MGLYTLLKMGLHMPMHVPAGGVSTVAMVACCAYHVTDVLPLVGLTAATTFLANWKIPFMVAGLLTHLTGIVLMLRIIRKERRPETVRLAALEAQA